MARLWEYFHQHLKPYAISYVNELRDLYSAETKLIDALPKMAGAANSSQLKQAFTDHLEQTEGHVRRLEEIFEALGEESSGETCKAMEGLIKEGAKIM